MASLHGSVISMLNAQHEERQECDRVHRGVAEPGEGAVEPEGDAARSGCPARHGESTQHEVGGEPGDQLEQDVLVELSVADKREQSRREECRRLHFACQRHSRSLIRIPPWKAQMD